MKLLIAIAVIWALAYFRAGRLAWTVVLAILLALGMFTSDLSYLFWSIIWLLFLAAVAVVNISRLRRRYISGPAFMLFREMLPPISMTEREALEAGTVWWDRELFCGRPDWNRLLSFAGPRLTVEEEAFLTGPVEKLCRMLDDWRIVNDLHDLPPEVWRFIREKGFFGMIIPKEYGGLSFSALAHSQVIMKLVGRSYAAAITVMVPNSLGPAELLLRYGTDEQKKYYLPRLARGDEVPCFALTGPEAGSDAASIPDTGIVCRGIFDGKEGIGIRLNWEKRYITLGPVATLIGLAFRLMDPDHLFGERSEPGITLALIPADTPGITIGSRHDPLGVPFQNGPNRGEDVLISLDRVVGGKAGIGSGWRMLMECLAAGRSISLPALSTGQGKMVARTVGAYARIRRQFHLPIGLFEGVEEALARIAGNTFLMDAARTMTCGAVDQGESPSVISAIVKYQCTERVRKVANDGMDVMGGAAISLGPHNLIARFYQGAPIGITVEGANILTRSMIIFGQGVLRCHPFILREMEAAHDTDPTRGGDEFDRLLLGHVGFTLANAARSLFHGVTLGYLVKAPDNTARRYFQVATRFSAAFALAADVVLLTLGGGVKRRERLSGRLADILGNLYLISALLKQFVDRDCVSDELPLLQWGCEECLARIQESFTGLVRNLPFRPAAWLLRFLIFPLGRPFTGPDDQLDRRVAAVLLKPSGVRDRLTDGLHIPVESSEPLRRLEDALARVIAAEPLEQRLKDAVRDGRIGKGTEREVVEAGLRNGVISDEEANIIQIAMAARREVIRVDDFPNPSHTLHDGNK